MQNFQVPVIAVFTKYDQFRRNIEIDVSDDPNQYPNSNVTQVAEERFREHYLRPLGDDVKYVRLESMFGAICEGYLLTCGILWQKCTRKIAAATFLLRRQLQH
jgi:predicted amino acid dehydrogenase